MENVQTALDAVMFFIGIRQDGMMILRGFVLAAGMALVMREILKQHGKRGYWSSIGLSLLFAYVIARVPDLINLAMDMDIRMMLGGAAATPIVMFFIVVFNQLLKSAPEAVRNLIEKFTKRGGSATGE